MGTGTLPLEGKRPECEAHHPPPANDQVKSEWVHSCIPPCVFMVCGQMNVLNYSTSVFHAYGDIKFRDLVKIQVKVESSHISIITLNVFKISSPTVLICTGCST